MKWVDCGFAAQGNSPAHSFLQKRNDELLFLRRTMESINLLFLCGWVMGRHSGQWLRPKKKTKKIDWWPLQLHSLPSTALIEKRIEGVGWAVCWFVGYGRCQRQGLRQQRRQTQPNNQPSNQQHFSSLLSLIKSTKSINLRQADAWDWLDWWLLSSLLLFVGYERDAPLPRKERKSINSNNWFLFSFLGQST